MPEYRLALLMSPSANCCNNAGKIGMINPIPNTSITSVIKIKYMPGLSF